MTIRDLLLCSACLLQAVDPVESRPATREDTTRRPLSREEYLAVSRAGTRSELYGMRPMSGEPVSRGMARQSRGEEKSRTSVKLTKLKNFRGMKILFRSFYMILMSYCGLKQITCI